MEAQRTIGGLTYSVGQDMVRKARPSKLKTVFTAVFAAFVGLPMFSIIAPFWYILMSNKNISQRFAAQFLPRVMPLMDKAFSNVKKELLKGLHGRVLDVGCGAGDWLKYFAKASSITELEPNVHLRPNIERNVERFKKENPTVDVEIVHKFVNELDPSKPYDYVVFGNVMCEVPDQHAFLRDIDGVLKPGGKIIFQEHIRYPRGSFYGLVQDIFNPWWCRASDGCNCNRETVEVIRSMKGWRVQYWDLDYDAPPILRRMAVGVIVKEPLPPASGSGNPMSTSRM